jgi:hypothetical protein
MPLLGRWNIEKKRPTGSTVSTGLMKDPQKRAAALFPQYPVYPINPVNYLLSSVSALTSKYLRRRRNGGKATTKDFLGVRQEGQR